VLRGGTGVSRSQLPQLSDHPDDPLELSLALAYCRSLPVYFQLIDLNHRTSMLHPDALAVLYYLVQHAGRVLELGPYVGGSTIALAWGLRDAARDGHIVSVELGGAYEHPTHGTDDVLRDLRANLTAHDVQGQVRVIAGNSRDPEVVAAVERESGEGFDLMVMDTDGLVAQDFALYGAMLRPRAYVVVDDYFAPGAAHKEAVTREELARVCNERAIECLGVYGWGTWVGRMVD
jgi:predicted O-methyltransferase YrrM